MGRSQRTKGQSGEREIAAILRDVTGWEIRRRVRQHDGDTDLEGVPGWSVEVKRHKTAKPGEVAAWWAQAVSQAKDGIPVLFYRADGQRAWSAVWPLAVALKIQSADMWAGVEWTATTSVPAWAAVAREVASEQMQDYETNALRKDAERYRFVRDGGGADSVDLAYHNTATADEFDAWIDGDMGDWRSK